MVDSFIGPDLSNVLSLDFLTEANFSGACSDFKTRGFRSAKARATDLACWEWPSLAACKSPLAMGVTSRLGVVLNICAVNWPDSPKAFFKDTKNHKSRSFRMELPGDCDQFIFGGNPKF